MIQRAAGVRCNRLASSCYPFAVEVWPREPQLLNRAGDMNATLFVCTTCRAGKPVVERQRRPPQLIIAEQYVRTIHATLAACGVALHRPCATPRPGTGPAA